MATFNLDQIKDLAIGRWPELLGLDNEILDQRHHPCPKCGGRDRFRALDDFPKSGAVLCNKCFNANNGDGIAAYAWRYDLTMREAIKSLAAKLGVSAGNGRSNNQGVKSRRGSRSFVKNKSDGDQQLSRPKRSLTEAFDFKPWNESLAGVFCLRKGGIQQSSLVALGAQMAAHAGLTVITLPIRNESASIIGYTAANVTGGKIAIPGEPDQPPDMTSWKNVKHKAKGIIGSENLFSAEARTRIQRVFKTEGPSDLAAIIPMLIEGEAAFCNPCGATENPENFPWLSDWLSEKQVIVIHDRDDAGVKGALGDEKRKRLGWATWAAGFASEVRNVELPFPLVESHGKDLRDWICQGNDRFDLEKLIAAAPVINSEQAESRVIEDGADPHYLARVNLRNYQEKHGRRLVFWKNEWFRWKAGCYVRMDISELRSKVTAAVRKEFELQWKAEFDSYQTWRDGENYDEKQDKGPPVIKKVTPQLVTAVISAMASMVQLPGTVTMPCWLENRSERHYVSMQNGILDFDKVFAGCDVSEFLLPHSSNWFSQFQLGYKFDFESKCPMWFEYLNYSLDGDEERIAILQEWAGYLLTTTNYLQKFIVLEGKGGNGKTVYFAAIRAMLGNENVSSVALENFGGRFDLATTIGKAANICGDVGEIDSVSEGALKQFTGGDAMTFDRKGTTPIEMIPTAKLMCAWNLRPRFKDRSSGVWRRMILVPFEREIEESRKIAGMDSYKFWLQSGEVSAILRWAIEGLDRLKTMGRFTRSKVCEKAAAEYRLESNPANDFLTENLKECPESRISCQWLYELYTLWCRQAGHNYPLARSQFGKEVKRAFPGADRKVLRPRDFVEAGSQDRDRTWFYTGIDFSVDRICDRFVYGEDV